MKLQVYTILYTNWWKYQKLFLQYKGFPAKFRTKNDLSTFLTRFIWLAVKHAINSYPLIPYGAYIPSSPTKLYADPTASDYSHHLPNILVSMVSFTVFFELNNLIVFIMHSQHTTFKYHFMDVETTSKR